LAKRVLRISNSMLSSFARCEAKGWLSFNHWTPEKEPQEERERLLAGAAAHVALERHLGGKDVGACLAAFDDELEGRESYKEWSQAHVPLDSAYSYTNITDIMRVWLRTHPVANLPFEPLAIEPELIAPLYELEDLRVDYVARADALVRLKDNGAVYNLDWKTTGRINSFGVGFDKKFLMDSQVSGQAFAARGSGFESVGSIIYAIEFSKLPDRLTWTCKTHKRKIAECREDHVLSHPFRVSRSPAQLRTWEQVTKALVGRLLTLSEGPFANTLKAGIYNGACAYCDFRDFCAQGADNFALLKQVSGEVEGVTRSGFYEEDN